MTEAHLIPLISKAENIIHIITIMIRIMLYTSVFSGMPKQNS